MKKKLMPAVIVAVLILLIGAVGFAVRYMPTKDAMDLAQYYGSLSENQTAVILEDSIQEERGLIAEGISYLPLTMVTEYLNQRYYWDSEGKQILYATPSALDAVKAADSPGGEVWLNDGTVYLSMDFIKKYTDVETQIFDSPSRIVVSYRWDNVNMVTAKKKGYVRYQGGIKSPVLTTVEKGDEMWFIEELENWVKVATKDGLTGYIEKKKVSSPEQKTFERTFEKEEYTYLTKDEKINLTWHQVTSQEANAGFDEATKNVTGVNVISPTWFSITDNSGNISSIASAEYVVKAHQKGMEVWGLIDNFNPDVDTTQVLSSRSARENIINQLVKTALQCQMDGINVDFETLSEDAGIHFLQFLRELSISCHQNDLVLSVDNPVPADFTSHYDRAEQGRVVDYVIIMGYDEHYNGSEAGSVASLPWVEQGIVDTLKEVPAERVINAVPFYNRVWKTNAGVVSSEAIGMGQTEEVISTHKVETYWDKTTGQNYGEYEDGHDFCQVWIEDAQSIAEKVKLIGKYELAGVASWKLGFEKAEIWNVITENLQ